MEQAESNKHGTGAFVLAGISFIPLLGVIPGIICIINALVRRRSNSKLLGILGFSGVMVSVVLYGVVLPSLFNNETFSKQFEPHAISAMTSLVRHVEYYKLQNNRYPKSMEELRSTLKEGEIVFSFDVSGPMRLGEKPREFYYEVINSGDNYFLFGVGSDGVPFTEDDIYPLIDRNEDKNIGWMKEK